MGSRLSCAFILGIVGIYGLSGQTPPRGAAAKAEIQRPIAFPHRIWAACDFEGRTRDYAWFGPAETNHIPPYPGNRTALGVSERPYQNISALMTGINPVPGPRMGKENGLHLRYFLRGGANATFQHFSLTREDNWHIVQDGLRANGAGQFVRVGIVPPRPVGVRTKLRFRFHLTGASAMTVQIFDATVQDNRHIRLKDLRQGGWTTLYVDFSRDGLRNDGTANSPFAAGNLVDDLFFFVEGAGAPGASLFVDEIVLFDAGNNRP